MISDFDVTATLPVADLERAKRFYGETLGFPVVEENPAGVFYRSGSTQFFVFPSAGQPSGTHAQIGFSVTGIDALVGELKSRGVIFEEYNTPPLVTVGGIATVGPNKAAWFKDTEGNLLAMLQRG
jgi:catechol 2,3-dioxygenase-like lactoylglutathione lyase family enzyme